MGQFGSTLLGETHCTKDRCKRNKVASRARKAQQGTNSQSFRREGSVKGTCGHYGRFCVQGEFCVPKVCDCSIAIDRFFPISTLYYPTNFILLYLQSFFVNILLQKCNLYIDECDKISNRPSTVSSKSMNSLPFLRKQLLLL